MGFALGEERRHTFFEIGAAVDHADDVIRFGHACEHVGLPDLPAHRDRHRVGERRRQRVEPLRQRLQAFDFAGFNRLLHEVAADD